MESDSSVSAGPVDPSQVRSVARSWWNRDAAAYQAEHGDFIGLVELLWCPEGLTEAKAGLLGDVRDRDVLEVGCGAAACSRWIATHGGRPVGIDLSESMLALAQEQALTSGISVPLIQADARALPLAAASFDIAFTAFGAIPFVPDCAAVYAEVARVLRPGGRWVGAVVHPMSWVFTDEPTWEGLQVIRSYTKPEPYFEADADGQVIYAEFPHSFGDHVRGLAGVGLTLVDALEPTWCEGNTNTWGPWGPDRAEYVPGTLILTAVKAG